MSEKCGIINDWCKSKECEFYIERGCYGETHVSCKLQGQTKNIPTIATDCPHKPKITKQDNPFCDACLETDCKISTGGNYCEMVRVYLKGKNE